jgi:hypothetical protein
MDHRLGYAREKLGVAVDALATSAKPIQDRLHLAYMSFHPLQERDFADPEMRASYAEIMRSLTIVKDGPESEGYVRNTLNVMSDEEAERVAELIVELNAAVRSE